MKSAPTGAPVWRSYDVDAQGTVVGLEKSDTGDTTETDGKKNTYDTDPYGSPVGPDDDQLSPDAKANPFQYQGFYKDQETGNYDMQARAYRPAVGQFLQQDRFADPNADLSLASDPLTSSRYAFTAANPATRSEYNGHCVGATGLTGASVIPFAGTVCAAARAGVVESHGGGRAGQVALNKLDVVAGGLTKAQIQGYELASGVPGGMQNLANPNSLVVTRLATNPPMEQPKSPLGDLLSLGRGAWTLADNYLVPHQCSTENRDEKCFGGIGLGRRHGVIGGTPMQLMDASPSEFLGTASLVFPLEGLLAKLGAPILRTVAPSVRGATTSERPVELINNARRDPKTGRFMKNPNKPQGSARSGSTHGNTRNSPRETTLYRLEDDEGNFLKWGITSNIRGRYSADFLEDKILRPMITGSRDQMLNLERWLIQNDRGPLNRERIRGSGNVGGR
jgi:RHS repeat-associated protein